MTTPLDDIFGKTSSEPPTETAQPAAAPEHVTQTEQAPPVDTSGVQLPSGQPRDEHGRFAPPAPAQAEPPKETAAAPPAAKPEPSHIPIAALLDERDKRQKAEREAEELRRWKAEQDAKARQPAEQPKAPNLFEDPEAYTRHFEQQVEQRLIQQRLSLSETWAQRNHADFDETMKVFESMAQANPSLVQRMLAEADPAEWAYQQATQHRRMQEIGNDPDAWARRRALELLETDEALRGEIVAKYAPPPAPDAPPPPAPPQLPTSLAAVTNAGTRAPAPWQGPTPLNNIIGRR